MSRLSLLLTSLLLASFALSAQAQSEQAPQDNESSEAQAEAQPQRPEPEAAEESAAERIERAYRREYAFLQAQRRELQQRLDNAGTEAEQTEQGFESELEGLEQDVVSLRQQSERLQQQLTEVEQQVQSASDNASVLESTFLQAEATLKDYGSPLPEDFESMDDSDKISLMFERGVAAVERLSQVRREQGAFYLADGSEVQGEILRIGNIAAFGIAEDHAGALAPAGEGRLKLWGEAEGDTARALAQGESPAMLDIFLFETLSNDVEEDKSAGVLATINDGGLIGWVIVVLGLLALLLCILRAMFLKSASQSTDKLGDRVVAKVRERRIDDALAECKKSKGATSRVLAATLRNLDRDRAHVEDVISESILHESAHLNRFGSMILVIAAVSPLLGLLGTVTGMIETFDVITKFGTGDPKLLSGGIATALVTTQLGLMVAIPALLLGNLLSGWAEGIKDDMEKAALRVTNNHELARQPHSGTPTRQAA